MMAARKAIVAESVAASGPQPARARKARSRKLMQRNVKASSRSAVLTALAAPCSSPSPPGRRRWQRAGASPERPAVPRPGPGDRRPRRAPARDRRAHRPDARPGCRARVERRGARRPRGAGLGARRRGARGPVPARARPARSGLSAGAGAAAHGRRRGRRRARRARTPDRDRPGRRRNPPAAGAGLHGARAGGGRHRGLPAGAGARRRRARRRCARTWPTRSWSPVVPTEGLAESERAIALDPSAYLGHFIRGWILGEAGRRDEERREYLEAVQRERDDADLWELLARSWERAGESARAREAWREVVRIDPSDEEAAEKARR